MKALLFFCLFVPLLAAGQSQAKPILKAKINIDSAAIHYPNSVVHVNADSCKGHVTLTQWLQISGPTRAIFTPILGTSMAISGLQPGTYRFQLFINGNNDDTASAYINVKMYPPVFRKQ